MSKWFCNNCQAEFDEPEEQAVDAEEYYGVGSMFPDHHTVLIDVCPECGDEDIEESHEEE